MPLSIPMPTIFFRLLQDIAKDEETSATPRRGDQGQDLWTRDLCIVGLILGWGAALASLSTGIYTIASPPTDTPSFLTDRVALIGATGVAFTKTEKPYIDDHRVYQVSEAAMVLIPLLLQAALTVVSACLDSIHSTTLRWALLREGRSYHNTNLRLLTASKRSGPNGWPANLAATVGLVLAYAGTILMTFSVKVVALFKLIPKNGKMTASTDYNADLGPDRFGIDFNAWGMLGLGAGLLIQSSICTWCMVRDTSERGVGTWNSNPLATARACQRMGIFGNSNAKPLTPDSDSGQPPFAEPRARQPSMRTLVPATRIITNWIWVVVTFYGIMALVVLILSIKDQETASVAAVQKMFKEAPDFAKVWAYFGQVRYVYAKAWVDNTEWRGLLIQCLAVAPFLFGLHLTELLGGLARDEAIWRAAGTAKRGASPETSLLLENVKSWPNMVVFVAKTLIPWIFGYGFACNKWVIMAFFPLLTVLVMFLIIGGFAEYLIRATPKGPQPATYGDVRALVALVDEESWDHDRIFWGDKGEHKHVGGVRVAGTAQEKLEEVKMDALYVGLAR
ncbi:hypothetical protein QBC39DRAFT_373927 [Podospora conica]|nr:hypothetical protein QBC39DRAFT_373927 [Schizothecium conicum]